MYPVRDQLPTRTFPFINYLLIGLNLVAFLWEWALVDAGYANLVPEYGLVPLHLTQHPLAFAPNIFTSMFLHGGVMHLTGNLLYLWIFGDNVEDAIGHFRYVVFYLLGGIGAALAQTLVDPTSTIPMVGASGAIAAVLAAYVSLYPRSPITVVNPVFPLWFVFGIFVQLPAWMLIVLFFFVPNLLNGIGSLALPTTGGIAFFAHIGGFLVGLVFLRLFMIGREPAQFGRRDAWGRASRSPDAWRGYDSYR